jgi:ABC-type sugar transport system ATPase subunit
VILPDVMPQAMTLPLRPGVSLPAGGRVTVGIRPEHLTVGGQGPARIDAAIDFVEHLGGVSYLHAPDHPGGPLVIKQDGYAPGAAGQVARVGFDPAQCHLFDETGVAVSPPRH